jgi:hypothetical protein
MADGHADTYTMAYCDAYTDTDPVADTKTQIEAWNETEAQTETEAWPDINVDRKARQGTRCRSLYRGF